MKKIYKIIAIILLLLLIGKENSSALDLKETIYYTFKNNTALQVAKKKLEFSILAKYRTNMLLLPKMRMMILNTSKKSNKTTLSIEYNILNNNLVKKIILKDTETKQAYEEYYKIVNEIIFNTIKIYQEVLTARKIYKIFYKELNYTKDLLKKIKKIQEKQEAIKNLFILTKINLAKVELEKQIALKTKKEKEKFFYTWTGKKHHIT